MGRYHKSVLLKETIDFLKVREGKTYVDATLGGGGHTFEILRRGGNVLGIDVDQDAIDYVGEETKNQPVRDIRLSSVEAQAQDAKSEIKNFGGLTLARGNFKNIKVIAKDNNINKVAGAVFDLGVSSHQIETPERGFSFQKTGPLDMRMDRDLSVKAEGLVNILTKSELFELFKKFGEERFAHKIADSIVRARKLSAVRTTEELVGIIRKAVPGYKTEINPATKIFQALRIVINDELGSLREALPGALELLEKKGRLVIISFHSLEDRIVKNQFKEWESENLGRIITKKPIVPGVQELSQNIRARSAKLRVFEKN